MTKPVASFSRFVGGLADYPRESLIESAYAFGRSVDVRSDPQNITLLPRTVKESGNVYTALPKWLTSIPTSLVSYLYDEGGNLYSRSATGSHTLLRTVSGSHGNGLGYFAEDDFVYYPSDKVIGRYGPISSSTPLFTDDFLGAQGGVPLNTYSLDLEASSSQYADRADSVTTSITGNLSIEAQIRPETLPTVGNTITLVSKWKEQGNLRSYRFDLAAVSGYFGDGSDGPLAISTDTVENPIDSACSGTSGALTLTATNAAFTAGQVIMIHQSRGTNSGTWQRVSVLSYTAGTITLAEPLNFDYASSGSNCAQVRVLKQYTDVTIDALTSYIVKPWDGTTGTGGILAFLYNGTMTNNGTINLAGTDGSTSTGYPIGGYGGGFRGGDGNIGVIAACGEGTGGPSGYQSAPNGNGGGGGDQSANAGAGGGGGNGTPGLNGTSAAGSGGGGTGGGGQPGGVSGTADCTTFTFGGGGGGCNVAPGPGGKGSGASGGGIGFFAGTTFVNNGSISANGGSGGAIIDSNHAGGSGAGGSILFKAQTFNNTGIITALGGSGVNRAAGGDGRIHLDYYTSYTAGTITPTLNVSQDNSLVTNTTYQLRLSLSSNGTNVEILAQAANLQLNQWQDVAVSWTAMTSTADFYLNATLLGSRVGSFTTLNDNASRFAVGAHFDGAGAATNFYDGLIDEVRLFSVVRTASDYLYGLNQQILTTTAGLNAYYKFNNSAVDASPNANNLTLQNSPVYSVIVPYPSPTTRLDIDQQATTTGHTYTTPLTISESATERLTITPGKDPQKSVAFLIASIGTGNWTVTVHDQFNNVIATATVANALLAVGYYEFFYAALWSPLTNFTTQYHFHITSTVADGTVTTGTADDLETVSFRTYYQFLMTDVDFHPVTQMLQFLVFGNGRYIAKLEATLYEPNKIALPAGWKIRCFGYWQEYLAIGCWKGPDITSFDQGRVYFWDGIAPTYNFFIDIPEGGVNALLGARGVLNIWAGYQGDQLVYQGGATADKIKRLPQIEPADYTEVFPGGVTMWKGLIRYGVAGNSNSPDIGRGGYTYGRANVRYPEVLTFDYPISTGSYGSTVRIGMMGVVGSKLLMGWQDNVSFGVDYVSDSNAVYPTGTVEFMITDNNLIWKQKELNTVVANYNPLLSGQTVTLKYKIDADSDWNVNEDSDTTDSSVARLVIPDGRYNQAQAAIDLTTSLSTGPTINGVTMELTLMESSGRVG